MPVVAELFANFRMYLCLLQAAATSVRKDVLVRKQQIQEMREQLVSIAWNVQVGSRPTETFVSLSAGSC